MDTADKNTALSHLPTTGISKLLPDEKLQLWGSRKHVTGALIKNTRARELFNDYLQHRCNGGRWKDFAEARNVLWQEIAEIIWINPKLSDLDKCAEAIGTVFRHKARLDEAHRRAVDGTEKPVYHKGEVCGYVREYSDSLLTLLLKADDPDRFMDRKHVTQQGITVNFDVEGIDMSSVTGIDLDPQ